MPRKRAQEKGLHKLRKHAEERARDIGGVRGDAVGEIYVQAGKGILKKEVLQMIPQANREATEDSIKNAKTFVSNMNKVAKEM